MADRSRCCGSRAPRRATATMTVGALAQSPKMRSSATPKDDRQVKPKVRLSQTPMLRSSVTPEDNRHEPTQSTYASMRQLRSSVTPEADRHATSLRRLHGVRTITILGRPEGRPPPAGTLLPLARIWLRSSVTPEGDRHR